MDRVAPLQDLTPSRLNLDTPQKNPSLPTTADVASSDGGAAAADERSAEHSTRARSTPVRAGQRALTTGTISPSVSVSTPARQNSPSVDSSSCTVLRSKAYREQLERQGEELANLREQAELEAESKAECLARLQMAEEAQKARQAELDLALAEADRLRQALTAATDVESEPEDVLRPQQRELAPTTHGQDAKDRAQTVIPASLGSKPQDLVLSALKDGPPQSNTDRGEPKLEQELHVVMKRPCNIFTEATDCLEEPLTGPDPGPEPEPVLVPVPESTHLEGMQRLTSSVANDSDSGNVLLWAWPSSNSEYDSCDESLRFDATGVQHSHDSMCSELDSTFHDVRCCPTVSSCSSDEDAHTARTKSTPSDAASTIYEPVAGPIHTRVAADKIAMSDDSSISCEVSWPIGHTLPDAPTVLDTGASAEETEPLVNEPHPLEQLPQQKEEVSFSSSQRPLEQ
eukprot:SAG31_NODE_8608_length_1420_cov_2.075700_1_plen_456_part_10